MPKLSEILGDNFNQLPDELKTKYKDIDLVDSSGYVEKEKYNNLDTTKKDIEGQLKTANKTIGDLKKDNTDNKTLQGKIDQYETDYKKLKEDSENKITEMKFNYALEGALTKANVKNTKAVKALLNLDSIKLDGDNIIGLNNQLEGIKKSDSYLFKEEQNQPQFKGVKPADGSKPPQGYNPWKKDNFNLTEQGKIFKENPEQAKQLMAQAGINI